MSKHLIDVGVGRPLLDIASYARRGPGRRDRLSSAEIELIARTVNRRPEVIVKVLTQGGQNLRAVRRHLAYLSRGGDLELETDDGNRLAGKGVEKDLLDDWDLDLEEHRRRPDIGPRADRRPPKLVHKILFSMPPGTPPQKVLEAVKNFAREEFGLKHRYTMVLHTDEPHPHVHLVVKAVSEHGVRLNIRKSTLRNWRREFASHLRAEGVAANATERSVRGEVRSPKIDGIYRAAQRRASTHVRRRAETVARELSTGALRVEAGKAALLTTRKQVEDGWRSISIELSREQKHDLANDVNRFVATFPPPTTDKELLAQKLVGQWRETQLRDPPARTE